MHTFVICAYQESPYLEECADSLLAQTVESRILIATSTDNEHIRRIAKARGLEVRFSGRPSDIAGDWNYAYRQAETKYVTIAHQDDIYEPDYAETAVCMMEQRKKPLLFFSDYYEIRDGERVYSNTNLLIKKAAKSLRLIEARNIIPFRVGGDEFLVIAIHVDRQGAEWIRTRWENALEKVNREDGGAPCVVACGFAFGEKGFDLDEVFALADRRMYEDKKAKKMDAGQPPER